MAEKTFFCKACLEDHPITEQSPDPRYCKWAYDFLLKEAQGYQGQNRSWIPIRKKAENRLFEKRPYQNTTEEICPLQNDLKSEVDTINPSVTGKKRGPKLKQLPETLILELADKGLGSKAIASELKEQGVEVSYKTIQRFLKRNQSEA